MREQEASALAERILLEDSEVLEAKTVKVGDGYEVEISFLSELGVDPDTLEDVLRRVSRTDDDRPIHTVPRWKYRNKKKDHSYYISQHHVRLWGYFIDNPGHWNFIRALKNIPLEEAIELEDTEDAVIRYFENLPALIMEPCLDSSDVLDALEKRGYSRDSVNKALQRLAAESQLYRPKHGRYCLEAG